MKVDELRAKPLEELVQLKAKFSREIMDARFRNITSQLKDTSQIVKKRRNLARINTIIREKQ